VVENEALSAILEKAKGKDMISVQRAQFDECAITNWTKIKKKREICVKAGKHYYAAVSASVTQIMCPSATPKPRLCLLQGFWNFDEKSPASLAGERSSPR
jgi:hypothetical protein